MAVVLRRPVRPIRQPPACLPGAHAAATAGEPSVVQLWCEMHGRPLTTVFLAPETERFGLIGQVVPTTPRALLDRWTRKAWDIVGRLQAAGAMPSEAEANGMFKVIQAPRPHEPEEQEQRRRVLPKVAPPRTPTPIPILIPMQTPRRRHYCVARLRRKANRLPWRGWTKKRERCFDVRVPITATTPIATN